MGLKPGYKTEIRFMIQRRHTNGRWQDNSSWSTTDPGEAVRKLEETQEEFAKYKLPEFRWFRLVSITRSVHWRRRAW